VHTKLDKIFMDYDIVYDYCMYFFMYCYRYCSRAWGYIEARVGWVSSLTLTGRGGSPLHPHVAYLPELGWLALRLAWPGSNASSTWGCPGMDCWDPGFGWDPGNASCPRSWIGLCVTGNRKKAGNRLGRRLEIHSGRLWAKASTREQ
jgi:hypothetical protein